ncbi:MAG: 3-oxoacid CoA-transferase subunit A [Variibacter sp.]|nr:3-oxoacid CoA-transferase subunit A [Variibacter sp.]
MIDKRVASLAEAVADVKDGSTVLCSGFGSVGEPVELIEALHAQGARDLVIVANNAGLGDTGLARLIGSGRVRKIICSFPRTADPHCFDEAYRAGKIELELVPQGTLSERIRAGGAGITAFYTRVSAGTDIAKGKEVRLFNGEPHVLEEAIRGDFAFIRAESADRWGNLVYRRAARNFNPVMACAAEVTVAQVARIVELGSIDPDHVHTPGIFVDRVVVVPRSPRA